MDRVFFSEDTKCFWRLPIGAEESSSAANPPRITPSPTLPIRLQSKAPLQPWTNGSRYFDREILLLALSVLSARTSFSPWWVVVYAVQGLDDSGGNG